MSNRPKLNLFGFGLIGIIIVVAIIGLFVGGGLYFNKSKNQGDKIACTQDVKQCSDGSYVGRTGPNCEFTKCPDENVSRGTVEGRVISLSDVVGILDSPLKGYLVFVVAFENLQKFIGQSKIASGWSGDIAFSIDNEEVLLNYVVASTTTAESGFYHFDLKPARYALCLADNKFVLGCYDVALAKKQKSKVDISWGLGGPSSNAKSIKSSDVVSGQIDTSIWKIYRSEKYGFEIKYPPDWTIDTLRSNREKSGSDLVFNIGIPESHEGVRVDVNNLSLDEWANLGDKNLVEGTYHLTIDGQPAIRIDTTEFGRKLIGVKFNGKLYVFTTGGRMIDNGMLSTFSFKSTAVDDSVAGRKCGGGVMGNGGACPKGYTCKINNLGPPVEGICVRE